MHRLRSSLAFLLLGLAAHGQIAPATSGLPSNSKITAINSGVTLSPTTVSSFPTFNIGAINGVAFNSSNRYVSYSGGTTQWINSCGRQSLTATRASRLQHTTGEAFLIWGRDAFVA